MKVKIFIYLIILVISIMVISGCMDDSTIIIKSGNSSSSSTYTNNDLKIYFSHSIKQNISFYLNQSEASTIQTYTASGEKFIFGGEFI